MQVLSQEQKKIVENWTANGGAMIVSASAGSGKTRVLTECVRNILLNSPKEHYLLLCLTFTNKAAEEMQNRLSEVKGVKERTFINTIHAFGLEILKSYRHELGFKEMPHIVEREADRKEILKAVFLQNPLLSEIFTKIPVELEPKTKSIEKYQIQLLNNTLQWISTQKRNLVFIDDEIYEYKNWKEEHLKLFKLYNQYLNNQNLIEFDDILLLAWKLLNIPSVVSVYRRLYEYILIDEGQDLNNAQYQVIKTLCGNAIKNIFIVGDNKQAINGYAGANSKFMFHEFEKDFGARKAEIKQNYRSSKAVLTLANKLIPTQTNGTNLQRYEGHYEILSFENEKEESKWVISKIKELITLNEDEFDGQMTLEKIAILGRNKFVFNEIQKQLSEDSFIKDKYFLKRGADVIEPESYFMKIFDLGTRLIANNQAEVYWTQILALLGVEMKFSTEEAGLERLSLLQKAIVKNEVLSLISYQVLLTAWQEIAQNVANLPYVLENLKDKTNLILEENERQNAQLDIEEWQQAWKSYIRNVTSPSKSLADFRRYAAMGFNKSNGQSGLTLATVHTSKGLEFHVVFLIGMNEGTFPDYRALKSNGKTLEEERNNAYVAITRAKRNIYITYPKNKTMPWGDEKPQIISSFVKEIELV